MTRNPAFLLALLSHALAWAALLWLVFWPGFYDGASQTAVAPGETPRSAVQASASLIQVNGLAVLSLLIVPVAVSAIAALTAGFSQRTRGSRALLWLAGLFLLGFCVVGAFSVGVFYVPSAVALISAAVMGPGRRGAAPTEAAEPSAATPARPRRRRAARRGPGPRAR